jgi:hypothetical protein
MRPGSSSKRSNNKSLDESGGSAFLNLLGDDHQSRNESAHRFERREWVVFYERGVSRKNFSRAGSI